jgi:hypothetical protein
MTFQQNFEKNPEAIFGKSDCADIWVTGGVFGLQACNLIEKNYLKILKFWIFLKNNNFFFKFRVFLNF